MRCCACTSCLLVIRKVLWPAGRSWHVHTASLRAVGQVTNDLVSLYYHMGDFGEVVPLYERHMERTREAFGEDHVAYLHIKRNLEMVNQYLGKQALGQAGSAQPVITQSMSDECRPGDQHCTPKSTAPAAVPR